MNNGDCPPPGARGPAYIAPPNEYGPSDQTDLNRTVFLNLLGWWSIIHEAEPVRSRGFWSLLDHRKLRGTLISLCKPDVWAFSPYCLIPPCRNRETPKLMEFCQIKP